MEWRVHEYESDGDHAVRDGNLERLVTSEWRTTDLKATTDGMAANIDIVAKCMGSILTHSWAGFGDVPRFAKFAQVTDLDTRTMPAHEIRSTVPEF